MSTNFEDIPKDMELAKRTLADPAKHDMDITEVAFAAGYFEIKQFNYHFRRDTGMCPREYRAFHSQFKLLTGMTPEEYAQKNHSQEVAE